MTIDIIPEPIEFEWDEWNVRKNVEKHGIENDESESVFLETTLILIEDFKHSDRERRYQALGSSNKGELLCIIFTWRKLKIRIISARRMNGKERKFYEENTSI